VLWYLIAGDANVGNYNCYCSVFTKKHTLWFFVCQQDYYGSNQSISLKFVVMIATTKRKYRLTIYEIYFGGDLVLDTNSGSLFTSLTVAE